LALALTGTLRCEFAHETQRPALCERRTRIERRAFLLKQQRCPHCGKFGALNRHSRLSGKGFGVQCRRLPRGQRVYCSNRGRKRGCGRTFSIWLCTTLPRHGVDAPALSRLIAGLLGGLSLKNAAESLRAPFALETFYHLRKRLRLRMDALRVLLVRQTGPPPPCDFADPLLHTLAHLRRAFHAAVPDGEPSGLCAWFQLHFQRAFLG